MLVPHLPIHLLAGLAPSPAHSEFEPVKRIKKDSDVKCDITTIFQDVLNNFFFKVHLHAECIHQDSNI